ncbi:MAG: hypothetical protein ACOH2F_13010 [Cellulomonas sp.]
MSLKDGCPECTALGVWCRECKRKRDAFSNARKQERWRQKRLEDAQQIACPDCRRLQIQRLEARGTGRKPTCPEHSGAARREAAREEKRRLVAHFQCRTCGITVAIQQMDAHLASKSHTWHAWKPRPNREVRTPRFIRTPRFRCSTCGHLTGDLDQAEAHRSKTLHLLLHRKGRA